MVERPLDRVVVSFGAIAVSTSTSPSGWWAQYRKGVFLRDGSDTELKKKPRVVQ